MSEGTWRGAWVKRGWRRIHAGLGAGQPEVPAWPFQAPCCPTRLSSWYAAMMWRRCCPQHLPAASSPPWRGSGSRGSSSCSTSPPPWTVGAVSPFPSRAARKGKHETQEGFLKERRRHLTFCLGGGHRIQVSLISGWGFTHLCISLPRFYGVLP